MLLSTILGVILTTLGLVLSFIFNLSSGATIVLVMAVAFLLSYYIQD
jgi:zinc transport system permease protein